MEKLARPVQPPTDLLKRPRGGNSPRAARRLSVLHLEHLCRHRLPLHIFRPLDSPRYPAFRAKLAGEEGFEPPHPVLETGGLPLNLLPYFTSRCAVCLRHVLQNFRVSNRSACFFLFLVVV